MSWEHEKNGCNYPRDPCSCDAEGGHCREYNKNYHVERIKREKTRHESWCGYPSEPCGCGVDKHPA